MFARRVYMHLKPNSVVRLDPEAGEGNHSPSSKAEGIPGRNHLHSSDRNGGVWSESVGSRGKCGSLQPRKLHRSDEAPLEFD